MAGETGAVTSHDKVLDREEPCISHHHCYWKKDLIIAQRQGIRCVIVLLDKKKALNMDWNLRFAVQALPPGIPDVIEKLLCIFFHHRPASTSVISSSSFPLKSELPRGSMLSLHEHYRHVAGREYDLDCYMLG